MGRLGEEDDLGKSNEQEREIEYTDELIAALEWIWGEGFLSPGGPVEVDVLLEGVSLEGHTVLDIGCGIGGIDILLAGRYGAGRVVGIDIEAPLVERAVVRARAAGLAERIEVMLVEPGPLPFPDGAFDVVFSKDAMIHIADKNALFTDILRVLRPGGRLVASDWLRGGEGPYSSEMQTWLDIVHLSFEMKNLETTRRALEQCGFQDVVMRDRNQWYQTAILDEIATFSGDKFEQLAARLGNAAAEQRRTSSLSKQVVVNRGELRPTHLYGCKPR